MNLTELIAKLHRALEESGDIEVRIVDYESHEECAEISEIERVTGTKVRHVPINSSWLKIHPELKQTVEESHDYWLLK